MLVPAIQAPEIIIRFDPNLSESHPARKNIIPFNNTPTPEVIDVFARLKPNSEEIGLKRAEEPCIVNT